MNVGDEVRLTKTVSIRNVSDGQLLFEIPSGTCGQIRRMLRADGGLVGVFFGGSNVEVAVSTRDLELVK